MRNVPRSPFSVVPSCYGPLPDPLSRWRAIETRIGQACVLPNVHQARHHSSFHLSLLSRDPSAFSPLIQLSLAAPRVEHRVELRRRSTSAKRTTTTTLVRKGRPLKATTPTICSAASESIQFHWILYLDVSNYLAFIQIFGHQILAFGAFSCDDN